MRQLVEECKIIVDLLPPLLCNAPFVALVDVGEGDFVVVIRMAKVGRKKRPLYTIVAADSRRSRDGRFLQKLGSYDPAAETGKTLKAVKTDAIASWIAKGAVVSDTVRSLLKSNKIEIP